MHFRLAAAVVHSPFLAIAVLQTIAAVAVVHRMMKVPTVPELNRVAANLVVTAALNIQPML